MGAPVIISRMDHTPAELRALAVKSDDVEKARRLLAIAMVLEGCSRLDAARQTGMDRQTLRDWVHRYNTSGVAGLVSRKPPGAAPKLTEAQMAELREVVIAGPDPKVHTVIRWRCIDLCAEVTRRFMVTVPERTMGKWLGKLGLTRLQPRPYHPKRDAAAQEAFKKLQQPSEGSPDRSLRRHAGGNLVPGRSQSGTKGFAQLRLGSRWLPAANGEG